MYQQQLVDQLQKIYGRELATCGPDELPYFVGFLNDHVPDHVRMEGKLALWVQYEDDTHLLAVNLADGTYEVRGVPSHEWQGLNTMTA